ncbi:MAG: lipoyl synthase, partial [Nitrospinae bacterium]|nr:lipoyl synthase [Nitrospinota bacterium]
GLGETEDELVRTMTAVRSAGARILTVGQYLAPSLRHAPVAKYYTEEFFVMIAEVGKKIGFDKVFSGPLVRSSYMADAI